MKKKILLFHLAYYILSILIYTCFLFGSIKLFHTTDLVDAYLSTYGLMFIATPILIAVIMRFSLLKWYVDPIAAAEVPLFLYIGMIVNYMNRSKINFYEAFLKTNETFFANGGSDWLFIIGLFLFSLIASFSIARKNGKSISYRLLSKFIS